MGSFARNTVAISIIVATQLGILVFAVLLITTPGDPPGPIFKLRSTTVQDSHASNETVEYYIYPRYICQLVSANEPTTIVNGFLEKDGLVCSGSLPPSLLPDYLPNITIGEHHASRNGNDTDTDADTDTQAYVAYQHRNYASVAMDFYYTYVAIVLVGYLILWLCKRIVTFKRSSMWRWMIILLSISNLFFAIPAILWTVMAYHIKYKIMHDDRRDFDIEVQSLFLGLTYVLWLACFLGLAAAIWRWWEERIERRRNAEERDALDPESLVSGDNESHDERKISSGQGAIELKEREAPRSEGLLQEHNSLQDMDANIADLGTVGNGMKWQIHGPL